ncbi:DUF4167 domain-containing protein [Novosphingobium sp. Leaf2]|uniref:DUF4167 domain-containing protein n=1 Tax=Novosphingobium sp. Leaf2 TaxID=1735670 RepID=UPI000701D296|nr:DUF4167 domain-containing protein [Novosphingobium sp. Leaf2]KQM22097.1 hypothetical protein ASE49_01970 [Novosphingobium sp. Leaf2]
MNNNRGNNRRRGRGTNNRPQGGGQQVNRIDSRARGNAPQMHEKYRKLAHDAHLNGDRVTEEYNLQFADHYFRVMADQKQRQEDARQPRTPEQRQADDNEDFAYYDDPYGDPSPSSASTANPQSDQRDNRGDRDQGLDRNQGQDRNQRQDREPRQDRNQRQDREPRQDREQRFERQPRQDREPRVERAPTSQPAVQDALEPQELGAEIAPEVEATTQYEPPQNPFVRDNRAARGLKQRKPRGERADDSVDDAASASAPDTADEPQASFDAAMLPPSISTRAPRKRAEKAALARPAPEAAAPEASETPAAEEKPRRRRTRKAAGDDTGAAPEAVNG